MGRCLKVGKFPGGGAIGHRLLWGRCSFYFNSIQCNLSVFRTFPTKDLKTKLFVFSERGEHTAIAELLRTSRSLT